jgi:predicted nucleic acid-binding protein
MEIMVVRGHGAARLPTLRLLIASEIGGALWKAVRRGDITRDDALVAVESALLPFEALVPIEGLRTRALAIAIDLAHPICACFYLALAERE